MGYDNSTIYKLICEDGHYYYGSTIVSLRMRLHGHKESSKTMTSRVYKHIVEIGWDKVKIECIERVSCKDRKELREVENKYILENRNDPLCLNTLRAYTSEGEKRNMEKERQTRNKSHRAEVVHKYYAEHKEEIRERGKQYYDENKEHLQIQNKQYQEQNKQQIQLQRKKYYDENKERLCREKREKREKNKEDAKQKQKEYRDKNREKINQRKRDLYHSKKDSPI